MLFTTDTRGMKKMQQQQQEEAEDEDIFNVA
jgi:hypothetical protein